MSPASSGGRPAGGFTERVKQELSRLPLERETAQRAELSALLRIGGALHLRPGAAPGERLGIEVVTTSGAVARRTFALLQGLFDLRPELRVRAPSGVQRHSSYAVALGSASAGLGREVGVLDAEGRPEPQIPAALTTHPDDAAGYLRGAVLATGSISAPGRSAHLEIGVSTDGLAEQLAALGRRLAEGRTVSAVTGDRPRVVVKSGETIGLLLTRLGATTAFLDWDEQRLRRSLRNQANRLANADAANLRRTIDASAAQTRAVEIVIDELGWDGIPDELRDVALARLANPTASLAELGELCDPPVGKSSVHRRLKRLLALSQGEDEG